MGTSQSKAGQPAPLWDSGDLAESSLAEMSHTRIKSIVSRIGTMRRASRNSIVVMKKVELRGDGLKKRAQSTLTDIDATEARIRELSNAASRDLNSGTVVGI